jgi:hypothetical protein
VADLEMPPFDGPITVGSVLAFLAPSIFAENKNTLRVPVWPPDVFAIAGVLLSWSGAYRHVLGSEWPPSSKRPWNDRIVQIGDEWWNVHQDGKVPKLVEKWWQILIKSAAIPVLELTRDENRNVCQALVQLCTAADEACFGIGVPDASDPEDPLSQRAAQLLIESSYGPGGATVCESIDSSRVCVLPKLRTPQDGITFRSLSHYLALSPRNEVLPKWHVTATTATESGGRSLNLLLIPWPYEVLPSHFKKAPRRPTAERQSWSRSGLSFFDYGTADRDETKCVHLVGKLVEAARQVTGSIDGVVFPELALQQHEFAAIRDYLIRRNIFLIGGVGTANSNFAECAFPIGVAHTAIRQYKHHRWRLDRRQIIQYGLGGVLELDSDWWENISVRDREVNFISLQSWLTLAVLICEDLARQDPVASLLRTIGPNLVICLLLDGPQLQTRWAARYATVLADDPGSSVLTLTSAGMSRLSRPPGAAASSATVIALWKDSRVGPVEICLPENAGGVVISLGNEQSRQRSADGRFSDEYRSTPVLAGVHPVFCS